MSEVKTITQNTLVPLSLVLTLLGGSAVITKALARIDRLEEKQLQVEEALKVLQRVDRRLFKLEVKNGLKNIEPTYEE